jgi:hypothetical protein
MQDRALRGIAWLGAVLLVLSGVLQAVFPRAMGPLPSGLRTPVLALELARSAHELETMFGPAASPERARWVAGVDRGNALDFAFIAIYCAFLIACMRAFAGAQPARARAGIALALLAGAADAIENACLSSITSRLGGDYSGALSALMIATWVKWLSIPVCLLILWPGLRSRGRWGTVAAWIGAATLPSALGAAVLRGVLAEVMLLANTFAFVAIWIEALRSRCRTQREAA